MSKPQVTITLGRSGQKVIKRPQTISDGALADSHQLSGSKRSMRERFKSDAHGSMLSVSKRLRGDITMRNPGYRRVNDARVGQGDLRLKLMRKRISRRMQREVEDYKKMEVREKMSRPIWSPEGPERSLMRHISPTNRPCKLLPVDSLGRSNSARTFDGLKRRSPDRVLKASRGISLSRNIDELHQVPSRPIDASRTGRIWGSDFFDPSGPKGHARITVRANVDTGKPVTELPPASSSLPKSTYLGEQPLTVSSLLHSLGLGKYAINFQAEEVDMAALKQMGDRDLKELGIPMGPRKKILVAILPHSKRQQMNAL